jgi:hypothetical protein
MWSKLNEWDILTYGVWSFTIREETSWWKRTSIFQATKTKPKTYYLSSTPRKPTLTRSIEQSAFQRDRLPAPVYVSEASDDILSYPLAFLFEETLLRVGSQRFEVWSDFKGPWVHEESAQDKRCDQVERICKYQIGKQLGMPFLTMGNCLRTNIFNKNSKYQWKTLRISLNDPQWRVCRP